MLLWVKSTTDWLVSYSIAFDGLACSTENDDECIIQEQQIFFAGRLISVQTAWQGFKNTQNKQIYLFFIDIQLLSQVLLLSYYFSRRIFYGPNPNTPHDRAQAKFEWNSWRAGVRVRTVGRMISFGRGWCSVCGAPLVCRASEQLLSWTSSSSFHSARRLSACVAAVFSVFSLALVIPGVFSFLLLFLNVCSLLV